MEVAWLGVYPALPIQLAKLGGGRECSHATVATAGASDLEVSLRPGGEGKQKYTGYL